MAVVLSVDAISPVMSARLAMTKSGITPPRPIEPLFATSARLWLSVWTAVQAVAAVVSAYTVLESSAGVPGDVRTAEAIRTLGMLALIVVYQVLGLELYEWILERKWAVALYVLAGWAMIFLGISLHRVFELLVFGAVLEAFLFLPFAWATLVLTLLTVAEALWIVARSASLGPGETVWRVVAILAMAITFGTMLLYIHHANRAATVRAGLLADLDGAHRELARQAHEAGVLEERQRLSHDLHDTLAQGFASVIRHLEAARLALSSSGGASEGLVAAAHPHLARAEAASRENLDEIRQLVLALRPPQLVGAGLTAAIERFVREWAKRTGVAAAATFTNVPEFQADIDVILLRVTQEALSNIAKHAAATEVTVMLTCVDGLVLLSIDDDGRGIADPTSFREGSFGLAGMHERVQRVGGRVMVESSKGRGTSVTVAIPLDVATAARK